MRIEAFLPSRHGFPGVLEVPPGTDFGLGRPALAAFGLSAGTAWVALDRYLAGRALPDRGQENAVALQRVMRRQTDALGHAGWHQLRDWQALPDRGRPGRAGLAERSRAEFRRLRQSIDDGMPVMLYLVLAEGSHADPSRNIAVLAYDYELDRRARRASVRVYDPARPGNDGVRLVFHSGADRNLDARLAVKTAVRGFFCVPYDRPEPAALLLGRADIQGARLRSVLAMHGSSSDTAFEVLGIGHDGRLQHVRRRRSGEYAAEHVRTDVLDGSTVERAAFVGSGRTVLWTSDGDLIDCRRRPGLGWRARRITDTRTHGTFDDAATGISRERGRVSLFACGSGRLMHFRRGRLPTWEAEHVAAGPLARAACVGTPAGVRLGSAMHVVARTRGGELMHARWRPRGGWTAENVTARAGNRERFLIVDDPVLLADPRGRTVSAVGRSRTGAILLFRWSERTGWRTHDLSAAGDSPLRSECALSATIAGDGSVHAVGRTRDDGLLHAWLTRAGTFGAEKIGQSRTAIGDDGRVDAAPVIMAGPLDTLHVVAARESSGVLFRWAHNADWSVERLVGQSGEHGPLCVAADPLGMADGGVAHAALLDEDGVVHHVALEPRSTSRRFRAPTWLVDTLLLPLTIMGILADGVSAITTLGRAAATKMAPAARAADGRTATPRPVPQEALPAVDEAAADEPLPLLAEDGDVPTGADAAPSTTTTPAADDTADDAVPDMLDGPLDHLLDAAVPLPRNGQDDADLDTAPVADEQPVAAEPATSATDRDAMPPVAVTVPADGEPERDAVPSRDDAPEDIAVDAPGDDSSSDTAAPASHEDAAAEPRPPHDDKPPAVSDPDALILVYPEPEKAQSRSDNGGGSHPDDAATDDVAAAVPPEDDQPLPLLHDGGEPELTVPEEEPEPWALPGFDVGGGENDWNAPADETVWNATPAAAPDETPGAGARSIADTDDDWNLPPEAPEPARPEPEPGRTEESATRSIADTDDDWNLPDDAPAIVPAPIESTPGPALEELTVAQSDDSPQPPAATDTASAPPRKDEAARQPAAQSRAARKPAAAARKPAAKAKDAAAVKAATPKNDAEPATEAPPKRRKWQNPALEGLPLLDDDDDDDPPEATKAREDTAGGGTARSGKATAARSRSDESAPAAGVTTKQVAAKPAPKPGTRKKGKAATDAMERMIALADANQPELLPPD